MSKCTRRRGQPVTPSICPSLERSLLSNLRESVLAVVKEHGLETRAEPFTLASGERSHNYLDGKKALAAGPHLRIACQAMIELAQDEGADFDAVGGLTLGADAFGTGIALLTETSWFVVRKAAKEHGKGRRIEGTKLGPGVRVLLVDDVVTTGGSILEALAAVQATGASIALAVTLVDRGDVAAERLRGAGVAYRPLITYRDLGIEPVGRARPVAVG